MLVRSEACPVHTPGHAKLPGGHRRHVLLAGAWRGAHHHHPQQQNLTANAGPRNAHPIPTRKYPQPTPPPHTPVSGLHGSADVLQDLQVGVVVACQELPLQLDGHRPAQHALQGKGVEARSGHFQFNLKNVFKFLVLQVLRPAWAEGGLPGFEQAASGGGQTEG